MQKNIEQGEIILSRLKTCEMAAIVASKVKRQRKESRNKRERASDSASTIHSSQLQLIHNHRFNSKEEDHDGRHFEVRDIQGG